MENSLKPNQCEILFETARKNWRGKILPSFYFYTYKKNNIYFKLTHLNGKSPVKFTAKLERVADLQTPLLEMDLRKSLECELSNNMSVCSKLNIPFRFAVPGTYFFHFHILDEKGEREIPESELDIIPMHRTVTDEIGPSYKPGSNKNYGVIGVIVLDYFSYQVRNLTIWLIGETAILIYLTLKMLK
jgi:hypothetical protein